MTSKLLGFLFPTMADMHTAISERVEKDANEYIERPYLAYRRIHYCLIPEGVAPRRERLRDEPIFLKKRPTLADIQSVLKEYPAAESICLNIDIRGFDTFQAFSDNDDPAMCDTGITLWKEPA